MAESKLCGKCGKTKALSFYGVNRARLSGLQPHCKACNNAYNRGLNATAKKKGRCMSCGSKVIPGNVSHCLWHYFKSLSSRSALKMGDTKAEALIAKWVGQKFRCPYTGEVLVPSVNLSVDHIMPKSTHPELSSDLSNIQLVTLEANRAKGTMSHEKFIDFCASVARRYSRCA